MTDIPRSSNTPKALAHELANLIDDGDELTPLLDLDVRANWWRVVDAVTGTFEEDSRDALTGDDLRYVVARIGRDLAFRDGDPVADLRGHAQALLELPDALPGADRLEDPENVAEAFLTAAAILERLDVAGLLRPMLVDVREYVHAAFEGRSPR